VNYLAHCLLAQETPEALIGSLAPDFSRPKDYSPPTEIIAAAMREHHAIDSFTDAHEIFLRSRSRFRPRFRHFAGAVTDVVYDHFLSLRWEQHCTHKRRDFVETTYATLEAHAHLCPEGLRECLPRMREQDWIGSYGELEGVRISLQRISRRRASLPDLAAAVEIVAAEREELQREFDAFFPELREYVRASRRV